MCSWRSVLRVSIQVRAVAYKALLVLLMLLFLSLSPSPFFPSGLGARGRVVDIINEENIPVFVSGFNEVINFPAKHLKLLKPKQKHRVLLVAGEQKGESGSIIGLDKGMAIVRLDSKQVKVRLRLPLTFRVVLC